MQKLIDLACNGKINENASLRDKQAIIINAKIERVWETLLRINEWPQWHDKIGSVAIEEVAEGASFEWKINNTKIKTTLRKITKHELIAWTGKFMGIKAIHTWKFEETEGNQTIVSTEESMEGFLTIFLTHQTLHDTLTYWLCKLKEACEK